MALLVTLLEMRTAVRERTDTVNSRRVTDTKLDRIINSAIRRLHVKVNTASEDFLTKNTTIPTVADQSYIVMPTDFLALRDVEWLPAAGEDPIPLERFKLQERAKYRRGRGAWARGSVIAYRLVGRTTDDPGGEAVEPPDGWSREKMELLPTPSAVYSLIVWYTPTPQTLSEDDATYDGRSGFEEWVIWDASIAVLIGEESDARQAVAERDRVWAEQILPIVVVRDEARPDSVVDVEGWDAGWGGEGLP